MRWLDRVPLVALLVLAVVLGLAPFVPEPHLVRKLRMLAEGGLTRPVDIFDLFWHGVPMVLLALKLSRIVANRAVAPVTASSSDADRLRR